MFCLNSSVNDDECVTKSCIVPVPQFPTSTSEIHTIVYKATNSIIKATNSSILGSEKVNAVMYRRGTGSKVKKLPLPTLTWNP